MAYTKKAWADNTAGGTPITAAELNRMEDGIARFYIDGVALDGPLVVGASILSAPSRVPVATTVRVFEIRLKAALDGNITFTLRRGTGTAAWANIASVTIPAGSRVGRVDPNTAFLEGDLLDVSLSLNSSTATSAVVSVLVDSYATAATTATPAEPITDTFTAANGTTLAGRATTTGGATWTVHTGGFTINNNRVEHSAPATGLATATVDAGVVNHFVEATVYGVVADNYIDLIAAYVDNSNKFMVSIWADGQTFLKKVVAGTATTLVQAPAGTVGSGAVVRLIRTGGNQWTVLVNGTQVLQSDTLQTDFATATRTGINGERFNATTTFGYDDFSTGPS